MPEINKLSKTPSAPSPIGIRDFKSNVPTHGNLFKSPAGIQTYQNQNKFFESKDKHASKNFMFRNREFVNKSEY